MPSWPGQTKPPRSHKHNLSLAASGGDRHRAELGGLKASKALRSKSPHHVGWGEVPLRLRIANDAGVSLTDV